jgi:hypothetical protein
MTVTIEAVEVAGAVLSQPSAALAAATRPLGLAALTTWLLDAGSGAYMLGTWIARGGLRRQRATGDRLGSVIVFAHFGMASTGLLIWASYLATQLALLGWLAIGLLMVVIGLGISTVTLWTPFPAPRAADTGATETGAATGVFAEPAADALSLGVTDDELARADRRGAPRQARRRGARPGARRRTPSRSQAEGTPGDAHPGRARPSRHNHHPARGADRRERRTLIRALTLAARTPRSGRRR